MQDYFRGIPGTPPPAPDHGPLAYAQALAGDGVVERGALRDYAFEYRISDLALENATQLAQFRRARDESSGKLCLPGRYQTYVRQALEVIFYLQKVYLRNTNYTFTRWSYAMLMALLLGTLYFNLDVTHFTGMNSKAAFVFATVVFGSTVNAGSAVSVVAQLKQVIMHQRAEREYPVLLHTIGFTLAEVYLLQQHSLHCCRRLFPVLTASTVLTAMVHQ